MMAHVTSPSDHNTVCGAVHVTSVSVIDAWRLVMRIVEITHVLPKVFKLAHLLSGF